MSAVTLTGARINLYINETLYKEVDSLTFTIERAIDEIPQIDSPYLAELAPNSVRVRGTINGMRLYLSGDLQGKNMIPLFNQFAEGSYIGIRIEERSSKEQIFSCFNTMISNITHTIPAKGIYRLSFNFQGIIPLFALDRS